LILGGGSFATAAAQRDSTLKQPAGDTTATKPMTVAEAVAAGMKLLGVFDAETGAWISGAVVRDTLGNVTSTSSIGVAALNGLAPVIGQYMLEIRKEGYAPEHFKLGADSAAEFLVSLRPNPLGTATALPAVITVAPRTLLDRDAGEREGFFQRCATNLIDCVGRKDLDVHPTSPIGMLLMSKKGITVRCPLGWTCETLMPSTYPTGPTGGSLCDPTFFLNGMRWDNGQPDLDNLLSAPSISGVEIYLAGSPIPARFYDPLSNCGVIVIWTR
jgi:hypothetical protein